MKLTNTSVSRLALDSGKTDQIFYDDDLPGFGLRIRKGGSRKWVLYYRQGGIQRRHTIGVFPILTPDEARRKARKVLVAVDDGKDPWQEKAHRRAAAGLIFAAVVDDYLSARQADMRPRTLVGCAHHLRVHWKPLHKLSLGAVSRPVVAAHLRIIARDSGMVAANRARSTLSALYTWAIGEGLTEVNPVVGSNKAGEEKPRDRVLSNAELAAIWEAAPDSDYGRIVKLLMLTGQRREEIGCLRWSEINMDARTITLPKSRTKNRQEHIIPLSDDALEILQVILRRDGRDLVFGTGDGGFSGWSKAKSKSDEAAKLETPWTLHDLRRTAATRMADIGVQPHVIEAVLNHVSGHKAGVAGIYNRSTYAAEKRAALDLWANHLRIVLAQSEGANVQRLRA